MTTRAFRLTLVAFAATFAAVVFGAPQVVVDWLVLVTAGLMLLTLWLMYVWVTRRIWRRR